ncbi:MAG: thioredoxin [Lachnospiraceae bacterium]|nr:thioredoxin [Lachnospiraceae bacterium]
MVKNLTASEFENEVLKSDIPVVVDCYADWCGPCKMMAPLVDAAANQYEGRVKFYKVNVDNEMGIATKYNVYSIPNFLFFKNGELVNTMVGACPPDVFNAGVDKLL